MGLPSATAPAAPPKAASLPLTHGPSLAPFHHMDPVAFQVPEPPVLPEPVAAGSQLRAAPLAGGASAARTSVAANATDSAVLRILLL